MRKHLAVATRDAKIAEARARYKEGMAMIDKQVADAIERGEPLNAQLVSMARNSERQQFDRDWDEACA